MYCECIRYLQQLDTPYSRKDHSQHVGQRTAALDRFRSRLQVFQTVASGCLLLAGQPATSTRTWNREKRTLELDCRHSSTAC